MAEVPPGVPTPTLGEVTTAGVKTTSRGGGGCRIVHLTILSLCSDPLLIGFL